MALTKEAGEFFDQLYIDMFKKLVRSAHFRLRDHNAAEDIAQDVFALAYENIEYLMSHPYPKRWLFSVLGKKLLHEYRARGNFEKLQKRLELDLPMAHPAEIESRPDQLDCLTETEYKMLLMIYNDGYTIRMVAEELGLTYETCRRHIQKAKDKIRDYKIPPENL